MRFCNPAYLSCPAILKLGFLIHGAYPVGTLNSVRISVGMSSYTEPRSTTLQVESEEATDLAKLRVLFPDYHSGFKDIVVDTATTDSNDDRGTAVDKTDGVDGQVKSRVKALGHMSDKELSSVVARHCRIFLSLCARRRRGVRALLLPSSCSSSSSRTGVYPRTVRGHSAVRSEGPGCTDAERLVAFGDSYRASVLLAEPTSRLPSCVVLSPSSSRRSAGGNDQRVSSSVLHMEEAFAGSHILALADAARLCKSGRSLLEDVAVAPNASEVASTASSKKKGFETNCRGGVSVAGWVGEGAAGRNVLLVDPLVNFQLDPNIHETRLADGPLAAVLRRVAGLLEEFPGHGILIQVCFVVNEPVGQLDGCTVQYANTSEWKRCLCMCMLCRE